MTLHIFNPECDLSQGVNKEHFTAPLAARLLRAGLDFLPVLWAKNGDSVLVEDVAYAQKELVQIEMSLCRVYSEKQLEFVTKDDLRQLKIDKVDVWGWDKSTVNTLIRFGVDRNLLPSEESLMEMRRLASRSVSAGILQALRTECTVGEAFSCYRESEIEEFLSVYHEIVLKAPWSCSGRGVRFVTDNVFPAHLSGWIKNTLKMQGCVMVEPYYKKIRDFGMEFFSDGEGSVCYKGFSLFEVVNGAYTGNILATESFKESVISSYLPIKLLDDIKEKICKITGRLYKGKYRGCFGVDMMVVADENTGEVLLHPCVEVNLRRTMGHVALAISPVDDSTRKLMIITKNNTYQLKIQTL